jgi:hypothetical protein
MYAADYRLALALSISIAMAAIEGTRFQFYNGTNVVVSVSYLYFTVECTVCTIYCTVRHFSGSTATATHGVCVDHCGVYGTGRYQID